jgi:hypothetical protein
MLITSWEFDDAIENDICLKFWYQVLVQLLGARNLVVVQLVCVGAHFVQLF